MTITQCDKCGNQATYSGTMEKWPMLQIDLSDERWDLCPKCYKLFKVFIKLSTDAKTDKTTD